MQPTLVLAIPVVTAVAAIVAVPTFAKSILSDQEIWALMF